jgi:hypothetical protein
MTQLRFIPASLFAAASLFATVLVPTPAHALQAAPGCNTNADCAQGFECTVVGTSGCAGAAAPCAPGASCPEPVPCEPMVQKACTPAHCESNADCADGMVCFDFPTSCADTACSSEDPDCGSAVPACDPQSNKMCAPRYVLPCQQAADCGEGFTCEPQLSCGCSGSSGEASEPQPGSAPTPAAGAAPAPDCACEPTGELRCIAKEITCTMATDCPVGWTCVPEGSSEDTPACSSGDCGAAAPPRPLPRSLCVPEYYGGGDDVDGSGTPAKGEEDGSDSGTGNGGVTPPQPQASGDSNSSESSACQMGHSPASKGAFSLLVVLGALFGLKRRRA